MENVTYKICRANQNTCFMLFNVFLNSYRLWYNEERYCSDGQITNGHLCHCVAHVHCILDTYGYKHILRISNTYCFSTPTMVVLQCYITSTLSVLLLLYLMMETITIFFHWKSQTYVSPQYFLIIKLTLHQNLKHISW